MGEGAGDDPLFAEEDGDPPIDFEAWMALSAQRLGRGPDERAAVLERASVEEADFRVAEDHWTRVMLADLGRQDMRRAEAYGARCAAELRRRATEAPSPEPSPSLEPPPSPSPSPSPLPSPSPSPSPSPERSPSPSPERSPSPPPIAATEAEEVARPVYVPSYLKEPERPAPIGSVTADALPVPRGNPLPFTERAAGAPPPAIAAAPPAVRPPPAALGETAKLPEGMVPRGAALPFAGAKPAAAPPPRDLPALSLEQYAAMCAESSLGGASLEQALGRYGLSDAGVWRAVDQAWQARLSADPPLMQRWLDLTARYRELLKRRPG